ncbi:MAG: beta-CASP ribonuclease aCPSF1 [Candidatus Woesearchaeota archaeon]
MTDFIKEVLKHVPKEKITEACFEGANIVLYTKSKKFFLNHSQEVRKAVAAVKKRIEVRPDPDMCLSQAEAQEKIMKMFEEEVGIAQIIFDPRRSVVIIEAEKPGSIIGRGGEGLDKIKEETLWLPVIKRTPPLRSTHLEKIRSVLYENSDERRKFLNAAGERIQRPKKTPGQEWVRITYLGSGRQVGRSALLLQTPESKVLFDCGIDVSRDDEEAYPILEAPEFRLEELDAIVVSHAHLDHTGFIPYLFKYGYRGPVYCTLPTRDIMSLTQLDTIKIARHEGKEPIYTADDIKQQLLHTIDLEYEEVCDITPDVRITFYNSGHMLGAAMVHIHVGNGLHNIVYSADIKYTDSFLLAKAKTKFPRCETLLIEGTYGGKDNVLPPMHEQNEIFADIIKKTIARKGKLLVPVLGSGRGQEIMAHIHYMVRKGEIDPVPVYVDGMVWDITALHTAYPEFLNPQMRKQIFHKDDNPFLAEYIKHVPSGKERQNIIDGDESCIILATSGMLVGGASVQYLKGLAEQKKNSLVFCSYLGPGSLGRRIHDGEKEIAFSKGNGGQDVLYINLEVHKIEITGHADRRELMAFVKNVQPRPRRIMINHGEVSRCMDLASSLHKKYRIETLCPKNLDAIRLR